MVCQCSGSSTATQLPWAGAKLVAQQIGGLGRPVGQCRGRQFDALTGRIVVVGDAGTGGVVAQQRIQNRPGQRQHLIDTLGVVEPAVMIGDGAESRLPLRRGGGVTHVLRRVPIEP